MVIRSKALKFIDIFTQASSYKKNLVDRVNDSKHSSNVRAKKIFCHGKVLCTARNGTVLFCSLLRGSLDCFNIVIVFRLTIASYRENMKIFKLEY